MIEILQTIAQFLNDHKEAITTFVVMAIPLFYSIVHAAKARIDGKITTREAIMLVINTLKDEAKMTDNAFHDATLQKIDKVAQAASTGASAVAEVKQVIGDVNRQNGIKVGSLNGKPVYLDQVVGIGSSLFQKLSILRGILRR